MFLRVSFEKRLLSQKLKNVKVPLAQGEAEGSSLLELLCTSYKALSKEKIDTLNGTMPEGSPTPH